MIYTQEGLQTYPKTNSRECFKRPQANVPVGVMVEELGLKGKTIGDAQISPKHAGIIVNRGHAKGSDIIALIEYIKEQVSKHYNICLHEEQIII